MGRQGIVTIEKKNLLEDAAAKSLPSVRSPAGIRTESQQGPREEVVGLFDEFRDPLLRYLSGFGLTVPDGEEVLQEVFLSLFKHLRDGKPRENLRGWLFRVAHNLALKRRGRTRRDAALMSEAEVEDFAVDPGPNPEQHLVNGRAIKLVMSVLRALPELDRRCLALRAEGLTYREIAEVLDMSLGSVCQVLSRSLARIAGATRRSLL